MTRIFQLLAALHDAKNLFSKVEMARRGRDQQRPKENEEKGEKKHEQAHHDTPWVRQIGRRHRRAGSHKRVHIASGSCRRPKRDIAWARGQARAHVLPRLRKNGMRRLGDRPRRPRNQGRRRPKLVRFERKLLRKIPGVNPGRLPSGPHLPSHEAHEPQGRGARLGARHLG